jgi:hypothetical protein
VLEICRKKKMRNWIRELNQQKRTENDNSFLCAQNKTIIEMQQFMGLDIQKTLLIASICV